MKPADRISRIAPFHVMAILAKARAMQAAGRDIIHMEVGEPDFTTPGPIVAAGITALEQGKTHYTAATGLPELRSAIAAFYKSRYGLDVAAARIVLTPGASGALQLVTALLANPGQNMLLADPGYPCNRHFLRLLAAEGKLVPARAEDGFQLTPELIATAWDNNSIAALVASPANPTGAVLSTAELGALYTAVKAKHGTLIVDEIYHGLTYGLDAPSALALGNDVFVINSFSKYFGMTGWRLGWLVAPQWAVPHLDVLAQNLFLAPPTPAQYAALAAFSPETLAILETRRAEFAVRREVLLKGLLEIGFKVPSVPAGAFYVYADITAFSTDSMEFCLQLLEEEGVAITPGIDFGEQQANCFVRFAYTTDVVNIRDALTRIQRFVQQKRVPV
jgi:aspartate/methionine/tyrosine aminotransferase